MESSTVKLIKWIVSTVISLGLVVVAALTCPDDSMHKSVVADTVKKEIKRQYDLQKEESGFLTNLLISGVSSVESIAAASKINRDLIVDNYWLFSIGSMADSTGIHVVSFGIFNHVFLSPLYADVLIHILAES